jgi:hypothetical protein
VSGPLCGTLRLRHGLAGPAPPFDPSDLCAVATTVGPLRRASEARVSYLSATRHQPPDILTSPPIGGGTLPTPRSGRRDQNPPRGFPQHARTTPPPTTSAHPAAATPTEALLEGYSEPFRTGSPDLDPADDRHDQPVRPPPRQVNGPAVTAYQRLLFKLGAFHPATLEAREMGLLERRRERQRAAEPSDSEPGTSDRRVAPKLKHPSATALAASRTVVPVPDSMLSDTSRRLVYSTLAWHANSDQEAARALDLARGSRDIPDDLRARAESILRETRITNGVFLHDLVHLCQDTDPRTPTIPTRPKAAPARRSRPPKSDPRPDPSSRTTPTPPIPEPPPPASDGDAQPGQLSPSPASPLVYSTDDDPQYSPPLSGSVSLPASDNESLASIPNSPPRADPPFPSRDATFQPSPTRLTASHSAQILFEASPDPAPSPHNASPARRTPCLSWPALAAHPPANPHQSSASP